MEPVVDAGMREGGGGTNERRVGLLSSCVNAPGCPWKGLAGEQKRAGSRVADASCARAPISLLRALMGPA